METLNGRKLKILKWLLFAGSLYFLLVSVVHMLQIKIPVFFIYYDIPSYIYQDRIISFLAFGWSIFLFTAFLNPVKNTSLINSILIVGIGAIIGLEIINLTISAELKTLANITIYQIETIGLAVYLASLIFFSKK